MNFKNLHNDIPMFIMKLKWKRHGCKGKRIKT